MITIALIAATLALGVLLCCADLALNPCERSEALLLWIALAAAGIASGALAAAALYCAG